MQYRHLLQTSIFPFLFPLNGEINFKASVTVMYSVLMLSDLVTSITVYLQIGKSGGHRDFKQELTLLASSFGSNSLRTAAAASAGCSLPLRW
jgi:hypothetical protein